MPSADIDMRTGQFKHAAPTETSSQVEIVGVRISVFDLMVLMIKIVIAAIPAAIIIGLVVGLVTVIIAIMFGPGSSVPIR